MRQKIYSGYDSYKKLKGILKEIFPERICLVTGKQSFVNCGAKNSLSKILNKYDYIQYSDFEVNPKLIQLKRGIALFKKQKCDFVIGIGGGSVIDVAKSISVLACNDVKPEEAIKGNWPVPLKKIKTLIIPTTAGSGSESTHFSTIYINKTKYSLSNNLILPEYVILDPAFTLSLPRYITACTGMDALCQAIESFWSVKSTSLSRQYSKKAIELSLKNIVKAVTKPDRNSRKNMLLASNYAGRAINIAMTNVAHALSYSMTSDFKIPHGHAVSLTLPYFIELNSNISSLNIQDKRGIIFAKNKTTELLESLGALLAKDAKNKILNIMRKIGLETKLSKLHVRKMDLKVLVKNGENQGKMKNNPRTISTSELDNLIKTIY